jgi:hypothetical protein
MAGFIYGIVAKKNLVTVVDEMRGCRFISRVQG